MARLPIPGTDDSIWGDILNEFLLVEHNPDGSLRDSGTLGGKYTKPASGIPRSHLADDVQTSLARADDSSTLAGLNDTTITLPSDGQVLVFDSSSSRWKNGSAPLPLTGGTLSGALAINNDLRIANPLNTSQYARIYTDNFWTKVTPTGTSGVVLQGNTVLLEPTAAVVLNTSTIRPQNNLTTQLGTSLQYFTNIYAQRYYVNATASLDGATAGTVGLSGLLNINGSVAQGNSADVNLAVGITRADATVNGPVLRMYKRGTAGDATASVKSGNNIFALEGYGYHGAGYAQQATIAINATQDWDANNRGASMSFSVTPNGSTTRTVALFINQSSQVAFNGGISVADGQQIQLGSSVGTKIGTSPTQKLGFFNATPVSQPVGGALVASNTYGANEQTMINAMWTALRNVGLMS